jgi:hypothetical protein
VKRVRIFLVVLVLIAGMLGCGGQFYALAITSTEGGSVTTPGEGIFTYDACTVVTLKATADTGYRFVSWTGNVSTISDVNAATTNITMNDNYTITADFRANFVIAAGNSYTVGVRADGTVVAVGSNSSGGSFPLWLTLIFVTLTISLWDIEQIEAGLLLLHKEGDCHAGFGS